MLPKAQRRASVQQFHAVEVDSVARAFWDTSFPCDFHAVEADDIGEAHCTKTVLGSDVDLLFVVEEVEQVDVEVTAQEDLSDLSFD